MTSPDGVWDMLSGAEAVALCERHRADATAACRALIRRAKAKWVAAAAGQGRDDVSAIVVFLPLSLPSAAYCGTDAVGTAGVAVAESKA